MMAESPTIIFPSSSSSDDDDAAAAWPGSSRRGIIICTTSFAAAAASSSETECRQRHLCLRRRRRRCYSSWPWVTVTATATILFTRLSSYSASANAAFQPPLWWSSCPRGRVVVKSPSQSTSLELFSTLSGAAFSQSPLDPCRITIKRRGQQRLSSVALFTIQTSSDSSGIPIIDSVTSDDDNELLLEMEGSQIQQLQQNNQQQQDGGFMDSNSIFTATTTTTTTTSSSSSSSSMKSLSSQQLRLPPPPLLRQLQKYKTNKDIETAIVRLGRKGRTTEALQLYHSVWKLDELRQRYREEENNEQSSGGEQRQRQQQLQNMPQGGGGGVSQEMLLLPLFKSKLRPTTRLMNSAIDACARSSSESSLLSTPPPVPVVSAATPTAAATSTAQVPRSRTRIALDIFHSGTSPWWSDDDNNAPSSTLSSLFSDGMSPTTTITTSSSSSTTTTTTTAAAATTTASTTTTTLDPTNKKRRKKKSGGALSPNVYTFGALLACCARDGDIDTSLELLSILEEGTKYPDVELNDVIYSTVISACANANNNNDEEKNSEGRRSGIPNNVKVALDVLNRGIMKLYQRGDGHNNDAGSKSSTTTGMMKMMGVVGYNAAISTMSRAGEWKMAVQLLGEMILHSSSSSTSSPSSSSNSSSSSSAELSSSLLLQRTNPNFAPMEMLRDDMTYRQLLLLPHHNVNTNSTSSSHDDQTNNNDGGSIIIVPKPDEVTFGTVLAACERSGEWETLLNVAKAAMEYGVKLDGMALTSVLHSCQQLGLADEALEYLELMKRLGDDNETIESNAAATTQQQDIRTTNGRHRKGAKQALRGPDGVAYRLAISACARAPGGQRWQDGIRLLREMKDVAAARKLAAEKLSSSSSSSKDSTIAGTDCAPDVMAYTAAIAGCSEAGEYIHAMSLISEMRREGIQPNVVTFSAVINACATASAKLARRRDEEDASGSGGSLESVRLPMNRALRLLEAMKSPNSSVRPNIVTYNAAIRTCAEGYNLEGAFDLLRQLKEDGMEPTIVTYGSLMTACERVGNIEAASKVFRMVKEEGKKNEDGVSSGKTNGSQEQIIQVNEIIYGAAISCCRKAQQPERALFLLRKMIDEKLAPNTATFNTVISALAESKGLLDPKNDASTWEKAVAVYRVMKSKHAPPGVTPNRKTYNILIRCLSSNLQPGYAESLLLDMRKDGFVPDVDLYTMTVRSYERCGNPMKALGLMESMREMGYDFYRVKVLDEAFKNGVKILNRMGKGFSTEGGMGVNTDADGRGVLYALSEESIDFDDYD